LNAEIVGINQTGYESDNALMCEGRDLPWLQDTAEVDVWTSWGVTYRDVWVLDANNDLVGVFNLTGNSLAEPANYNAVKALFYSAAE
jgi:hypothetical protein